MSASLARPSSFAKTLRVCGHWSALSRVLVNDSIVSILKPVSKFRTHAAFSPFSASRPQSPRAATIRFRVRLSHDGAHFLQTTQVNGRMHGGGGVRGELDDITNDSYSDDISLDGTEIADSEAPRVAVRRQICSPRVCFRLFDNHLVLVHQEHAGTAGTSVDFWDVVKKHKQTAICGDCVGH